MVSPADIVLLSANARYMHPALGLRCLLANLGDLESRTTLKEYILKTPASEAAREVLSLGPRLLGISVSIWNQDWTIAFLDALANLLATTLGGEPGRNGQADVAEQAGVAGLAETALSADERHDGKFHGGISGIWKGPLIVLGGPQVWFEDESNRELKARCHVVVQGSGETVFAGLARDWLESSPGFLARLSADGALPVPRAWAGSPGSLQSGLPLVIQGRSREFGSLKRPYHLYSPEDLAHGRFVYVESSRGCPHSCAFCMSSMEKDLEFAPLEEFLGDMESLLARGARRFKVLDRTFNAHIPRAVAILAWFRTHLPHGAFVQVELEPGRFPEELKAELAAFPPGMLRLEIGIQTLNPLVAALVKRPLDPDRELGNLAWLGRHTHATVHADLIAGLPGEDLESFAAGFDRLWESRPGEIQLGMLKRLGGTGLSKPDPAWGMVFGDSPPWQVQETSVLSREEVTELARFAKFWELVVNRDHFETLVEGLLPPGEPAFDRFRNFARAAWTQFGRTHSIDRRDLEGFIVEWLSRQGR